MSFYENQHRARRNTSLLVAYFVAAVVLIVVAVNAAIYIALAMISTVTFMTPLQWVQSGPCWLIALGTVVVIAGGSLFRLAQLSKGGLAVALMAGGTPIDPNTRNLQERTLINITEEMAIASGTRVPRIFILRDEPGINAFVAGTEPGNTVLAVTQGTLDTLTRDELQGVIGHEFSHILNGDMGLNVRLIGILAGILLIGQIGEFLLRSQRHRSSRNSKNGGQLAVLGLALMAIGYVGLFFGRLIKAAISRQREFLADASSVQFTRNPGGIAGALYAIGAHSGHSNLMNRHAEDMSHMCFGETLKVRMSGMLATHPPIDERIKAIDPQLMPRLKARWQKRQAGAVSAGEAPTPATAVGPNAAGFAGAAATAASGNFGATSRVNAAQAGAIKASVGTPTPAHAEFAHQLHQAIPPELQAAAHDPAQADVLLYALLFTEMRSHGQESLALIGSQRDDAGAREAARLYGVVKQSDPALRLPLLEITLATLCTLGAAQQDRVVALCDQLIRIDSKVTLSEFIISYLVRRALQPAPRHNRAIKSFSTIESSLALLFSAIVQSSGESRERQQQNFQQIMQSYSGADWSQALASMPSPKQLTTALDLLAQLTPLLKQPVIDACVDCVLHDNKATLRELEVLRAVCEALECPMPPLQVTLRQ
jgi:Zn-dependent protease with chaperone function